MSNFVHTLAQWRVVGSATKKAVLLYLADRASDDGSGIWMSKATAAAHLELSKRSVQKVIGELEADALVSQVGQRPCEHGYTVEYRINIDVLKQLPEIATKGGGRPRKKGVNEVHGVNLVQGEGRTTFTGRGEPDSPKPSIEPSIEPSNTPQPPQGERDLFAGDDQGDKAPPAPTEDQHFEEFWQAYPKKAGKPAARKAFAKAVKRAPAEVIIRGARLYASWLSSPPRAGEFRPSAKHPQGWLNDDRWEDDVLKGMADPQQVSRADRARRFDPPSWQPVVR
ncbi:helix-turn-helix domain-containing protein [Pseudooceanicola sp. CBS1P-1]|uniref:Helix-turn-helix domain-containing protein n=1 Tax=Pseudooceanicola albus TaxID=2692189 RepID=A0A6L7G602_9RHOB|nr:MULTISPECIES: helix-turn-helix domain-containing protein [Pseudooceanicola]MBT9385496.1 helix-turn-helix domain-containing protein [Pseudooceanicola endophyticus]MXN19092.1 hypothetical protein [Pseudooceanicola albus]